MAAFDNTGRLMKKFTFTIWDSVVLGALVALGWGRSAQTILLAAIAFLLYLLVRSQFSRPIKEAVIAQDDNEFDLGNDGFSQAAIELDVDVEFRPLRNHFRFSSRFDTVTRRAEYEYKVEGTGVFARQLHESLRDPHLPEPWEVRDGVLLESELRERWKAERTVLARNVEEDLADRRKALEWFEILPTHFNGLKYFILSKNLPREDARRFLRQEMERLKLGSRRFIEAATKIGFVQDAISEWRLRLPEGVNPTDEERARLFDSTSSFGISRDEFLMAPNLIVAIEKSVA